MRQETLIIWAPILGLNEQTGTPEVDPSKISTVISKLKGMLAACGKWTEGKLDAAATEFSKAFGKNMGVWGARGITTLLVAHQFEIVSLIRAAEKWLSTLPLP